jgi:hypothetical protein
MFFNSNEARRIRPQSEERQIRRLISHKSECAFDTHGPGRGLNDIDAIWSLNA